MPSWSSSGSIQGSVFIFGLWSPVNAEGSVSLSDSPEYRSQELTCPQLNSMIKSPREATVAAEGQNAFFPRLCVSRPGLFLYNNIILKGMSELDLLSSLSPSSGNVQACYHF